MFCLESCGISISICWPDYAIFCLFTLAACSLLPLKVNCVLCSAMGSNSTDGFRVRLARQMTKSSFLKEIDTFLSNIKIFKKLALV